MIQNYGFEVSPMSLTCLRSHPFPSLFFVVTISLIMGCDEGRKSVVASPKTENPPTTTAKPFEIVTTTGMVADLVRQVVGDRGHVAALMGTGADPHLYKPSRHDVRRLLDADMIVYSGLQLEHRLTQTLEQVGRSGKPVWAITEQLPVGQLRALGSPGQFDPHVWMDVRLWSNCVGATAERFAKLDPDHAEEYRARAAAYQLQLDELDRYVTDVIAGIPADRRVLVTAHDAFGYFAARYGLEVHAVQGVSTESEAGVNDVNRLVEFLVTRGIPAIFVETSVAAKPLQAVLEGCAARGASVRLGGSLYSDAMGPIDTYEGTYLGMIDANATRIAAGLGGTPPSGGWRGQLSPVEPPSPPTGPQ